MELDKIYFFSSLDDEQKNRIKKIAKTKTYQKR